MNLDKIKDRMDIVVNLRDYAKSIIDRMADDSDTDANDWCNINRFMEKLVAFVDLMFAENSFVAALNKMNNMKQSDEDSKWTFQLEKEFNWFIKEVLMENIDNLIDCSRSWSFNDYRARNFQNELRQKMTMLKDWYNEAYDSEDDDE